MFTGPCGRRDGRKNPQKSLDKPSPSGMYQRMNSRTQNQQGTTYVAPDRVDMHGRCSLPLYTTPSNKPRRTGVDESMLLWPAEDSSPLMTPSCQIDRSCTPWTRPFRLGAPRYHQRLVRWPDDSSCQSARSCRHRCRRSYSGPAGASRSPVHGALPPPHVLPIPYTFDTRLVLSLSAKR